MLELYQIEWCPASRRVREDGEIVTGFVGAYPAATIGRFLAEEVLGGESVRPAAEVGAA